MREKIKKCLSITLVAIMFFSILAILHKSISLAKGTSAEHREINEVIGARDYTTKFWTAWSDAFKIDDNMTYTFSFENHGSGVSNWNNFHMIFMNSYYRTNMPSFPHGEEYIEYAFVRADSWGWGIKDNISLNGKAITYTNSIIDAGGTWEEWLSIIKDSDVTLRITRSGSEIKVEAVIISQTDNSKNIYYTISLDAGNVDGSAPDPLYMVFTVDECYINLKYVDIAASGTVNTPLTVPTVTPSVKPTPAPVKEKQSQIITASSIVKPYGSKSFWLDAQTSGGGWLSYEGSDEKVAVVSEDGEVYVKGYGKTTVSITASETSDYSSAIKSITITVVPKKAVISKLTSKKKGQIACKIKKQNGVTGYEYVITAPSGIKKIIKNKKTSLNTSYISKVKYRIKVRAYKKIGKKLYRGAWSKQKIIWTR